MYINWLLSNNDLEERNQIMSFSGVGGHDQNWVVERAMQTVVTYTRIMMLDQAIM